MSNIIENGRKSNANIYVSSKGLRNSLFTVGAFTSQRVPQRLPTQRMDFSLADGHSLGSTPNNFQARVPNAQGGPEKSFAFNRLMTNFDTGTGGDRFQNLSFGGLDSFDRSRKGNATADHRFKTVSGVQGPYIGPKKVVQSPSTFMRASMRDHSQNNKRKDHNPLNDNSLKFESVKEALKPSANPSRKTQRSRAVAMQLAARAPLAADYQLEGSGHDLAPELKKNYFDDFFGRTTQRSSPLQISIKSAILGLALTGWPQASHALMDGGPFNGNAGVNPGQISQMAKELWRPGLTAPYFFTRSALRWNQDRMDAIRNPGIFSKSANEGQQTQLNDQVVMQQRGGTSLLPELDMPESYDVQDQLMFLMSMSPLLMFMDYFDNGIRNPLRKQFSTMQMQAASVLSAAGQLDKISPPPKMNMAIGSIFGDLFKKPAPKQKPPRPNLPPDYEEALKKHVDKLIDENEVVIFSTTTCPWCVVAETTLSDHLIGHKKINLNTYAEQEGEFVMLGPLMHQYVVDLTGRRTVPNIVVKQDLIGGNTDLNAKVESGELKQILDKYQIANSLA